MTSLRAFLDALPDDDILRITDPVELDYRPTALVLALEKAQRFPVVCLDRPKGFDVPVVTNLFAHRSRIARAAGVEAGQFNAAWLRALENPTKPEIVSSGPVQGEHLQRAEARGRNLEVAVVIGAHPAIYLAAGAKVGMEVDEFDIAGALLGCPVQLVRCKTINVEVPAEAEYVIEGELLAGQHEDEGPYGEYTGYSTSRSTRNVFAVKAITRRARPIFLDIIPGYSMEHLLLGRSAKEAHVFNRLREMVPNLKAISYPKSGTHFHAYLSLKKSAEGQARHALMLLFGLDTYVKFAVAVDADVDVLDEQEVLWAIATRFQADKDMFVVPNVFCNRLDPSSADGMSAKLGLDATAPLDWDVERTSLPTEAVAWADALITRHRR